VAWRRKTIPISKLHNRRGDETLGNGCHAEDGFRRHGRLGFQFLHPETPGIDNLALINDPNCQRWDSPGSSDMHFFYPIFHHPG
jgi:hypothetical protein